MKNILAENMLRFGVKNLSESDITKIEETLTEAPAAPIQPYAAVNPNSWKFKDDAAWTAVVSPASYGVLRLDAKKAADGVYGPWAWELIPSTGGRHQMNPNALERARFIAEALASIMNAQGRYNPLAYKDFANVLKSSYSVSNMLKSKLGGDHSVPLETIGNPAVGVSDQINTRGEKMSQQQWEATLDLIANPILAVINKYVVPAAPKPAAPGTPAPAKKV
jgi:hypothetical protein